MHHHHSHSPPPSHPSPHPFPPGPHGQVAASVRARSRSSKIRARRRGRGPLGGTSSCWARGPACFSRRAGVGDLAQVERGRERQRASERASERERGKVGKEGGGALIGNSVLARHCASQARASRLGPGLVCVAYCSCSQGHVSAGRAQVSVSRSHLARSG